MEIDFDFDGFDVTDFKELISSLADLIILLGDELTETKENLQSLEDKYDLLREATTAIRSGLGI